MKTMELIFWILHWTLNMNLFLENIFKTVFFFMGFRETELDSLVTQTFEYSANEISFDGQTFESLEAMVRMLPKMKDRRPASVLLSFLKLSQ